METFPWFLLGYLFSSFQILSRQNSSTHTHTHTLLAQKYCSVFISQGWNPALIIPIDGPLLSHVPSGECGHAARSLVLSSLLPSICLFCSFPLLFLPLSLSLNVWLYSQHSTCFRKEPPLYKGVKIRTEGKLNEEAGCLPMPGGYPPAPPPQCIPSSGGCPVLSSWLLLPPKPPF